ncbi:hypothetical protein ACFRAO_14300 [Streptomyces sp. NPDC056656]|uniref:hypothetical protein n=1 Tax=Streptomyces sp. NPDC056656 TaxID=3345895 RepID=UPI0036CFE9CE
MVFHSEYADVEPVDEPVHDAVLGGAAARGDAPALIVGVPRAASGKILCRQLRETS